MNTRMWVVIAAVWCAVLWMLPFTARIDIGRWDDVALNDFYGVEYGAGTSFRWSKPDAQITATGLGSGRYDVQLMASAAVPTTLTVRVADSLQHLMITPGFTRYTIPVDIPFGWRDATVIDLHIAEPTYVDRRAVGVALDEVRFVPYQIVWPALLSWLLSFVAVGLTAYWCRWWVRSVRWRWLLSLALVTGVIILRRGDAVFLLWSWLLIGLCGIGLGQQWHLSRRYTGWVVVLGSLCGAIVMWLNGIVAWQPIWQFLVLMMAVWGMRWRRWWWPYIRPYRQWLMGGVLILFAVSGPVGWVIAGVSGVVWLSARRWRTMWALTSLGPLLDSWLNGRRQATHLEGSRRFGLDVLRSFAISSVVLGHASATLAYYPEYIAWVPRWFAFVGVECFFVLSGWLIGGLIIRALPTWHHSETVQLFLHRRWSRTLPPYWLMLVLVVIGGWGGASWSTITEYWIFGQNIWQAHPPYFFVAWSLSVEEWFYLLAALGLAVAVRWMRPTYALVAVLGVLSVGPFVARTVYAIGDLPWEAGLRQFVPLRLDAIAIGVIMVWWWHASSQRIHHWHTALGISGALVSIWLFWQSNLALDDAMWPRMLLIPLTSMSVALLLPILAAWHVQQYTQWHRGVQWLAYISYSLYLVHIPWRLTIEGLFGGIGITWWRDAIITALYLVGAVWLAWQWYHQFEAPMMALRWSDTQKPPVK